MTVSANDAPRSRRVLRLIALERCARSLLLLAAGVYLVSHLGSDFGRIADHVMRTVELDPRRPFLHRIIVRLPVNPNRPSEPIGSESK